VFLFLFSAGAGRGLPEAAGARQRGHSQLTAYSCHQAASSLSLTLKGHFHEFIWDILNSQPIHAIRQPALLLLYQRDILTSLCWIFLTHSPFMPSGSQFSFSYFKGTFSRVYVGHSQLTAHSCHQAAQLSFSYIKGTFSRVCGIFSTHNPFMPSGSQLSFSYFKGTFSRVYVGYS
jgi:hypothetical protein